MNEHYWQVRLRYERQGFSNYGALEWSEAEEESVGVVARTIEDAISAAKSKREKRGATVRNVRASAAYWLGEVNIYAGHVEGGGE